MHTNLHKSEEGWRRFRERTNSGEKARRADMRASAAKSDKLRLPKRVPITSAS